MNNAPNCEFFDRIVTAFTKEAEAVPEINLLLLQATPGVLIVRMGDDEQFAFRKVLDRNIDAASAGVHDALYAFANPVIDKARKRQLMWSYQPRRDEGAPSLIIRGGRVIVGVFGGYPLSVGLLLAVRIIHDCSDACLADPRPLMESHCRQHFPVDEAAEQLAHLRFQPA